MHLQTTTTRKPLRPHPLMSRLVSLMHQLCSMHVFRYEKNQKIYMATD